MAKYAVLSDVHGNLPALDSVLADIANNNVSSIILLGDLIDYGMQSNEVVHCIMSLPVKFVCKIWGNHEMAILRSDFSRFSTERGVASAKYTASCLSPSVKNYLNTNLETSGYKEFDLDGKKCLAVHGSLSDPYWKSILPDNVNGNYENYDIVFSGHSHYPHVFHKFYDINNPLMRNKKSVLFINPGSVGQPRNHNRNAQYAIFDSKSMETSLKSVVYDVSAAMSLFSDEVDLFYKDRLNLGI